MQSIKNTRFISLVSLLVISFFFSITSSVFAFSGPGTGIPIDPYIIANCVQLQEMNDELDATYVFANDIDCSDTSNWNGAEGFVPIGDNITPFVGTLDGQNYSITDLYINRDTTPYQGLFGYLGSGAAVNNFSVIDADITTTAQDYVAIVAGYVDTGASVSQVSTTGSVTGLWWTAGLVGYNKGSISNVYSRAAVTSSASRIGGLIGENNTGTIANAYAAGVVDGGFEVGGLVGVGLGATDSFWDTETTGQGISADGEGKTTAEMTDVVTFTEEDTVGLDTAWDFAANPNDDIANDDIWDIDNGGLNDGYPYFSWEMFPDVFSGDGAGIDGDPYEITSCEQLIEVNEDLAAYYELTTSLDCALNQNDIMIGTDLTPFTGSFNGGDNIVTIDVDTDTSDYAGLFRSMEGGIITNLGVAGTVAGNSFVGGLVGYINNSNIDASFSSVDVMGADEFIGGLVGYINTSTVQDSSATGNVIGGTENIGGFVGEVDGGATVEDSYATGNVYSNDPEVIDIGGFAGDVDESNIEDSYATGDVTGFGYVGGFIGDSDTDADIRTSYSTGTVTGTDENIGGFIGDTESGVSITNSYSLSQVNGADDTGGFVGDAADTIITNSYSAGPVSGSGEGAVGGFIGEDEGGNTFTRTFFDIGISELENACGEGDCVRVVGETTENMKDADTFNPYPEITYGFPLADIASYRYIKWEITKVRDGSDTDCYTGDVCTQASEFLPTFDGFSSLVSIFDATATNPGGVNPPGQQAGYLFDGDTSTKFLDAAFSTSNNSEGSSTIIFDVFDGYEVTFNGYNWATGDDMTTRDPVSWTVSGSTDDITYELLDTQTDYATTIDRETFVGGENDNWDFYNVWGIDEEGEDNDGYPFLQWQDFEYEYSSPVDSETESPRLYTPESSSTHIDTDELEITFNLPETLLTGSLTLTFAPEEGDPIILVLDDAAPDVENSFSLTPSGGIGLVEEVVSTTADSIPGGIYTVTISYQDASGNPAATDSVTDVEIQELYVITEVTPISGNITDTSPVYHFAIDGTGEAELLVSEGCGEDILATALGDFPDDQQVQFNSLEVGQTYECTVSVNSDAGLSNELTVGPFTVISSGGSTSGTTRSARINNLRAQGKETEAQKIEQEVTKTVIPTIIPPLTRLLKYKMIGEEVRIMQQLLNKKGYTLALTGPGSPGNETQYYGPKTLAMIKKFQLANGLIPDGIVGPLTWGMLNK